jgi:hypothetical protein
VVARRTFALVLTAGTLAVATVGGSVALAQQEPAAEEAAPTGDEALRTRLDALEADLPADPAPTAVTVEQDGEEGDPTGGTFEGDVTGAAATIDTLEADLLALYVDADDADSPVADAVAQVARGWLDLGEGYDQLAVWEGHDLAFPIDAEDDEGTATDADALRGRVETGLRLVLGARQRHQAGYGTLRDLAVAEPTVQTRLDARADQADAFDVELRPLVHRMLSLQTTEVVAPVERFETDAPGVDARARSMTITCVDRRGYEALTEGETPAETIAPPVGEGVVGTPAEGDVVDDATAAALAALAAVGDGVDRADCPDLPLELPVEE